VSDLDEFVFNAENDAIEDEVVEEPTTTVARKVDGRKNRGKRVKHPLPDGFVTPSDLAVYVNFHSISDIDATGLYALANNEKKGFPSQTHTDGRVICNRSDAVEWITKHADELAARQAKRAERVIDREETRLRTITKATFAFARNAANAYKVAMDA
jgi:hypothetical protein